MQSMQIVRLKQRPKTECIYTLPTSIIGRGAMGRPMPITAVPAVPVAIPISLCWKNKQKMRTESTHRSFFHCCIYEQNSIAAKGDMKQNQEGLTRPRSLLLDLLLLRLLGLLLRRRSRSYDLLLDLDLRDRPRSRLLLLDRLRLPPRLRRPLSLSERRPPRSLCKSRRRMLIM